VSDHGPTGQELRLPQDGASGSGHLGDCERRRSGDEKSITDHPGYSLVGRGGGPIGGFGLSQRRDQNLRTREVQERWSRE
jgi:hypothetical protein